MLIIFSQWIALSTFWTTGACPLLTLQPSISISSWSLVFTVYLHCSKYVWCWGSCASPTDKSLNSPLYTALVILSFRFHFSFFLFSQSVLCRTVSPSLQPKSITPRPPPPGERHWLVQWRCLNAEPARNCGNCPNLETRRYLHRQGLHLQNQHRPPLLPQ